MRRGGEGSACTKEGGERGGHVHEAINGGREGGGRGEGGGRREN